MSKVLVSLIIQLCSGDSSEYYVQQYPQDCHHYMINCAVRVNGDFTEQTVRECHENKKSKIVGDSKRTK